MGKEALAAYMRALPVYSVHCTGRERNVRFLPDDRHTVHNLYTRTNLARICGSFLYSKLPQSLCYLGVEALPVSLSL